MTEKLTAPKEPCGSCPYRRDVPSGIWEAVEYRKLPAYDGQTWQQAQALFMCHQHNGDLCGGWLGCHGAQNLLAVRLAALHHELDPALFDYRPKAALFGSGQEACDHGLACIEKPSDSALKKIGGLLRQRARRR